MLMNSDDRSGIRSAAARAMAAFSEGRHGVARLVVQVLGPGPEHSPAMDPRQQPRIAEVVEILADRLHADREPARQGIDQDAPSLRAMSMIAVWRSESMVANLALVESKAI